MANTLYTAGKAALLKRMIDETVKLVLIDSADYTIDPDADQYLDDIPSGAQIAISAALAGKSADATTGAFKSDPAIFSGVTGDQLEAFAMFFDTGDPATSELIYFGDTGITGMPYTPSGNDARITPDASGWFGL